MGLTRITALQISNIDYKQAVRVVTVTNITLSGGAPALVDGVSLVAGDRVLVTGQSTASQNGLYYVATLGVGSNGTWSRSGDADATGEILAGMIVMVTEGTTYADTQWKLTTNDPITVGTTGLTFVQNYLANSISSGTSNVSVNANGNVTISAAGTANVLVISSTGTTVTGTESVTGNITGGNLLTAGLISATGNITGGNLSGTNIAGTLTTASQTNITSVGTLGSLSVTGNVTGGNVTTAGLVSATGNVTGNYILGNGAFLSGVITSVANINNGTSNVTVVSSGGNITVGIGGTGNVVVFATTGEYVTGVVSASGNVTGGNIITAGLVTATGNVNGGNVIATTLVQGTTVSASGNVIGGNVTTAGLVSATGNVNGGNVIATTLVQGTTVSASGNVIGGNVTTTGLVSATGNVTGGNLITAGVASATGNITTSNYFVGNGAFLTGISAAISVSKIENGNSNVWIQNANGNVTVSTSGVADVAVFTPTALLLTGFYENPKTISANLTVHSNVNALLIGPITVANGVNITVPTTSTLDVI